jgi:hypothetical protein
MKRVLTVLSLALLFVFASAQEVVISPQAIVVNPRPAFNVEVWVDKDPTGRSIPVYQIGEEISIGVRVDEAAYIYLFNVRSDGEIQQLLPNRFDEAGRNNFLRAGEVRYFPPRGANYTFNVAPPRGIDKVIALASKRPLSTSELADFSRDPNFATSRMGEARFAEALSIVIRPIPQNEWVTATALFSVGQTPRPVATTGRLELRSSPSGSAVYLNGSFVGNTPLTLDERAGRYEILFSRDGYEPFRTTVNLAAGETRRVSAELAPLRRTGRVTFDSTPRGAEVYLDGRYLGITPLSNVTLDEGRYEVRFRLAGYQEAVQSVNVRQGATQTVRAELRRPFGSLELRANVGGARVFINGEEVGRVPSGSGRLLLDELPVGRHQLTVVAPGYNTAVETFTIRAGETTQVRVQQTRR